MVENLTALENALLCNNVDMTCPQSLRSYLLIRRLGTDLETHLDLFLSPYKLSTGRFLILLILENNKDNGLAPSTVSQKIGVTQATISGLLNSLQKSNLISRQPHQQDARSFVIKITPEGSQLVEQLREPFFSKLIGFTQLLDSSNFASLNESLLKIAQHLSVINTKNS